MNKKTRIISLMSLVLVIILLLLLFGESSDTLFVPDADEILFEQDAHWVEGCSPDSPCYQSTKLYYSGMLIQEGYTEFQKQLDQETVAEIIQKIRTTDIMNKDCPAPVVMDYSATYKLRIDNHEKTIEFPGCDDEIRDIERLIPKE